MAKVKARAKKAPAARTKVETSLHDSGWIHAQLEAFAREILAQGNIERAMIVGIRRRGAELARRVCERVRGTSRLPVVYGALDIGLYRDDSGRARPGSHGLKGGTDLEDAVDERVVYLIDDVIHTGRTIRAAIDQLMDFGRPSAIRLYSLIDRGARELPIQPDRVAERLKVPAEDRIEVRLNEVDGVEGVYRVAGGMR